eukprot:SAG11_NODE_39366_length_234_cov_1.259259_1_plen_33_part_01
MCGVDRHHLTRQDARKMSGLRPLKVTKKIYGYW